MPFSPETQPIIAEVARLSGRPVQVEADAGLKTLAQVRPARGVAPAHFVCYQRSSPRARDRIPGPRQGHALSL